MFDQSSVIVGLEVGTSKICAVVGEVNDAGGLSIIGVGQARSRGVRKGEIIDAAIGTEDIRNAVVEAEQMADVEVRSVYLGVSGGHLRGFNNRGVHPVVSADREITDEDVQDAVKNAKAINLPAENHVVHVIRQHFRVDGQDGIQNPVGMLGAKVEVDVHVVHGNFNRLQNPIRAVKSLQLEVEDIVFNGLASSLALLSSEQKELGALVIDLGGGTTEYVVCADGIVKHTGLLAVGGDHISNDLAYGLKVPLSRAERLKIEHGSARVDDYPRASGGEIVRNVGRWNGNPGSIRWSVTLPSAGSYVITVWVVNVDGEHTRSAQISVSGADTVTQSFTATSDCCSSLSLSPMNLAAGLHTVTIGNPTGRAPSIDKIVIARV